MVDVGAWRVVFSTASRTSKDVAKKGHRRHESVPPELLTSFCNQAIGAMKQAKTSQDDLEPEKVETIQPAPARRSSSPPPSKEKEENSDVHEDQSSETTVTPLPHAKGHRRSSSHSHSRRRKEAERDSAPASDPVIACTEPTLSPKSPLSPDMQPLAQPTPLSLPARTKTPPSNSSSRKLLPHSSSMMNLWDSTPDFFPNDTATKAPAVPPPPIKAHMAFVESPTKSKPTCLHSSMDSTPQDKEKTSSTPLISSLLAHIVPKKKEAQLSWADAIMMAPQKKPENKKHSKEKNEKHPKEDKYDIVLLCF